MSFHVFLGLGSRVFVSFHVFLGLGSKVFVSVHMFLGLGSRFLVAFHVFLGAGSINGFAIVLLQPEGIRVSVFEACEE